MYRPGLTSGRTFGQKLEMVIDNGILVARTQKVATPRLDRGTSG